jgi:hypothetical protein
VGWGWGGGGGDELIRQTNVGREVGANDNGECNPIPVLAVTTTTTTPAPLPVIKHGGCSVRTPGAPHTVESLPDPSSSLRIVHPARSATSMLLPLLNTASATGQLNLALSGVPSIVAGGSPDATLSSLPPTVATSLESRLTLRTRSLPLSAT